MGQIVAVKQTNQCSQAEQVQPGQVRAGMPGKCKLARQVQASQAVQVRQGHENPSPRAERVLCLRPGHASTVGL